MTHQTDVDVLIVGAGPTGLVLGCLLAQYGVKFKIIEKNKTITTESKALTIQARTLELFEQLGIAQKAVEQGHPVAGLDLIVRGKLRTTIDLMTSGVDLTKYPYLLILEQCKTEQLLWKKLESYGSEVEWLKELVELKQHSDFVTATVHHFEKLETIRAKYVVAADGARSSVRTLLGVRFEGTTNENRFLLADIAVKGNISRQHITLCLSRQGFTGFVPMPGPDRFRAIGLLPEGEPEAINKEFTTIAREIEEQAQIPMTISDPLWISTYKIHHRNAVHFKEQRCFFAGDAAHMHSPVGGQGMNAGIQDAFNLAWKLHWVLAEKAHEKLLETYHDERFPVAKKLLRTTDQVFSFVTNQGALLRWSRLYLAPSILGFLAQRSSVRSYIFNTVSQIGIGYRKSPLSEQSFHSDSDNKSGDRICVVPLDGCFQAYVVGGQEIQKEVAELLERYFGERIKVYTLDKKQEVHSVLQSFGIFKDGLVLVRPDGYAAYCADGFDLKALLDYLDRFFLSGEFYRRQEAKGKEAFPFESFI